MLTAISPIPKVLKNPEIAEAKTTAGVPLGISLFVNNAPTAIRATTASPHSISIAPYPISFASFSLSNCFDVVPDPIKL